MDLKQLADNLGLEEDEYIELIGLFIDTGHGDLEKLSAAIQSGDSEKAMHSAHSIKGAAGNLGLMAFFEKAAELENMARNGVLEGASESLLALKNDLLEIEALLNSRTTS